MAFLCGGGRLPKAVKDLEALGIKLDEITAKQIRSLDQKTWSKLYAARRYSLRNVPFRMLTGNGRNRDKALAQWILDLVEAQKRYKVVTELVEVHMSAKSAKKRSVGVQVTEVMLKNASIENAAFPPKRRKSGAIQPDTMELSASPQAATSIVERENLGDRLDPSNSGTS